MPRDVEILIDSDSDHEVLCKKKNNRHICTENDCKEKYCNKKPTKVLCSTNKNKWKPLVRDIENILKLQEEVQIKDKMVVMDMDKHVLKEERKKTVVFRTFNTKAHKLEWLPEKEIEVGLKPVWEK